MNDPQNQPSDEQQFPAAKVRTKGSSSEATSVIVSRLWVLTLLCAIVAAALVSWQVGSGGPEIEVQFAEGHGLQAGDPVRYRGITVGEVREIVLGESLDAVIVRIHLTEASADIAREGSQFWIERPNISIGKVRGLDTLVGGRFVGVLPGPSDAPECEKFYGLEVASEPVGNIAEGLEVILEGRNRYGLQTGSPVNYRGVTVGQILSVGLTNDSATVEARAYIQPQYRQLVREGTKFWSSSGLDVKIGFSGIELDADTLATIAAGGVAFATPNLPGNTVSTGQRFELHKSPKSEWLGWQPRVAIGSSSLPPGVVTPRPTLGIRTQSGALGVLGAGRQRGWLLLLDDGRLLGPASVLAVADAESYQLEVAGAEIDLPLKSPRQHQQLACGLAEQKFDESVVTWPVKKLRVSGSPEEIVITCGSAEQTLPVAAQRLKKIDAGWQVGSSVPLDDSWHGGCVVAAKDGMLIGLLIRDQERSIVVPLSKQMLGE